MPTLIGSWAGTDEVSAQPAASAEAVKKRLNIALLQYSEKQFRANRLNYLPAPAVDLPLYNNPETVHDPP
jgi:hypothetical protein